jgi:hypothetical protein
VDTNPSFDKENVDQLLAESVVWVWEFVFGAFDGDCGGVYVLEVGEFAVGFTGADVCCVYVYLFTGSDDERGFAKGITPLA